MKYDLTQVLRDLMDIKYQDGLHTGRWEDEYGREYSSTAYLDEMESYAKKYQIYYDDELENYRDEDHENEYQMKDAMGFEIQLILEKKLVNLLLENIQ